MVIAGILLMAVAAQSVGAFGGGSPTVAAPSPLLLVLPLFNRVPVIVVLGLAALSFWAWAFQLFRRDGTVPRRTLWLFGLVVVLSVMWFALGWKLGMEHEGVEFTLGTAALSFGLATAIALLLRAGRRSPAVGTSLAAQWLLFAWILTYAFPYLGETP